jgi:hypothetical protein
MRKSVFSAEGASFNGHPEQRLGTAGFRKCPAQKVRFTRRYVDCQMNRAFSARDLEATNSLGEAAGFNDIAPSALNNAV